MAGPGIDEDLAHAVDTFRVVGDLRCLTRGYLRQALLRPSAADQVPHLERALEVARRAGDSGHQATALEHLVRAHWETGDRREAAIAFGSLVNLVGRAAALERCPDAMAGELDRWDTAVAEGRARGPRLARS